jgi:hypothetical protein
MTESVADQVFAQAQRAWLHHGEQPEVQTTPINGHAQMRVKGQSELPSGGHESCPLTVTRSARWWPRDLPKGVVATTDQGGQFNGLTP